MAQLDISKLRFVLFDWDNTLAESRSSLVEAVNQVLAEYHLPEWEISKEKRDHNLSFKDNFPRIFGDKAEEAYAKYREIYRKIVPEKISTFDKVPEVLDFFKSHRVGIMVMTNKERCLIDYELPFLFDSGLFKRVVCGHEAPHDKPDGAHALYTLKGLIKPEEINPDTVWVIGDSPQDSQTALAINARPIRINKSIWGDEGEKSSGIVYFKGFHELLKALRLAKY